MKKLLFWALATLVIGSAITSCKGKSQSDSINDSIATTMGKLTAAEIKASLHDDPEMSEKLLDRNQYIKGVMTIVNMDTTKEKQSYIRGLKKGMQVLEEIIELEEQGITVDRRVFLDNFKNIIYEKKKLDATPDEMKTKLAGFIKENKKSAGSCQEKNKCNKPCQEKDSTESCQGNKESNKTCQEED